jgi:hypothetical protein
MFKSEIAVKSPNFFATWSNVTLAIVLPPPGTNIVTQL